MTDENDYSNALEIVNRYYQAIVERMAHEICEREDSIMDGGFGWMEIEDRYANKFFNISQIYCNLKKFSDADPDDEEAIPTPIMPGVDASHLQVDERNCATEDVRETIATWLEENTEVKLWNLRVIPEENGNSNCLFLFTI